MNIPELYRIEASRRRPSIALRPPPHQSGRRRRQAFDAAPMTSHTTHKKSRTLCAEAPWTNNKKTHFFNARFLLLFEGEKKRAGK